MDKNQEIKHICENCKHFRQHYIMRSDRFSATCFGHCANGKRQLNGRLQYKKITNCLTWELAEEKKDIKKTVESLLEEISIKLETVKNFLTCTSE